MSHKDIVLLCFALLAVFVMTVDDYTTGRALHACSAELKEFRAAFLHDAARPGSCVIQQGDYFAIVDLACLSKSAGADKR